MLFKPQTFTSASSQSAKMSILYPEFRHITEEVLREWKSSSSGSGGGFKYLGPLPMHRFIYEFCWAVARGDLPIQKCKVALDSVEFCGGEKSKEGMDSVFADIIAHIAQDTNIPGDCRSRLVKLVKWLVDSSLVPRRLLHERCEEDFLWDSELIKMKVQDLRVKEVRVNTRLLYQQTKFNLLREESEGYAKLITLLLQSGLEATAENTSVAIISVIKSLIGHFDLDPNRVFDIVLECFELHPNCSTFYSLIPIFPKSNASQILGFKFQYYQRLEVKTPVPLGLFRLAALLVKAELIDLDSVCVHLLPKDDQAIDHYNSFLAKRLDEVNKIGKINLAATGKDLMDEEKQDTTTELFVALDMENESVAERSSELESNQWLGLLIGFLSVDDWHHARILFNRLSHLNPAEHIQICDELFRVIQNSISSACDHLSHMDAQNGETSKDYTVVAGETSALPSQLNLFIDLPKDLFQMLIFVGPYLYRDPLLLQRVCRVLRAHYLSIQKMVTSPQSISSSESTGMGSQEIRIWYKEARIRIEDALGSCLLPSLQLIPANPAIGQKIWEVLCLLPYEARYRLYGEWEKEDEQLPVLLAARQFAKLETRRILKRLAKENLKQKGRMVAKLAHANPMTVLRTIVNQIEAYKDMITPVVDAFKYLTQLEYDILEYVVIERLAQGGREKLKEDGLNLSDWLQSLASFWGHLCKKYPSMELRGLFQYLVNQLKMGTGIELVLLQELIQQMANVQYTENMTEEQLDAMAGSETLRALATAFGVTKNNKALLKSTNRLRDSLLPKDEPKLAIPLLLLIAQHRSRVVVSADVPYIKMVSEHFDRCHGTLLQYMDFLSSALTPIMYAQLIPTIDDLVHKYHLEPEVAFLIYRPVMRLFKCPSRPEILWPLDCADDSIMQDEETETFLSSRDFVLDLGQFRKPIVWSDLLKTISTILPTKAWNSLSPDLYATFWGLSLYDLYVPKSRYNLEIAKQNAALKALEELSDNSSSAIVKRKKEKERIQELLDKLTFELQKHEHHVASVHRRLSYEKDKWLSSCPDTLKINMEFFQRCLFPRCIFSMSDAVYCAMFVQTVHTLGTPYFNTVNHIDILICKTLQPMISCCTEFEAGRLGRFLRETLKMVYYWKSDESIYERECGNMPGFAVYYRFPNSQRVTFSQFVKVHLKWSTRLTKLLIHCLESTEYMEIRNALITLTKISSVFPVTRRSGVNLEKRVAKIKLDEREDLKVLATGVAAALAARKSSWISEEEFGMGYIEPKTAASPAKVGSSMNLQNGSIPSSDTVGAKNASTAGQLVDSVNTLRDQSMKIKTIDGRTDVLENLSVLKPEIPMLKTRGGLALGNSDALLSGTVPHGTSKPGGQKNVNDVPKATHDESITKASSRGVGDSELRPKRSTQGSISKQQRQDVTKDDSKTAKSISRNVNQSSGATLDRDGRAHPSEGRQGITPVPSNGNLMIVDAHGNLPAAEAGASRSSDLRLSSAKDIDNVDAPDTARFISGRPPQPTNHDDLLSSARISDKQQKRSVSSEEQDRLIKRRKGDNDPKDGHLIDNERVISEEESRKKPAEKPMDKTKDKINDRHDKDHREKFERTDKTRMDDALDKTRDRSMERYGRERSIERVQERGDRGPDRSVDKVRDDRIKDERGKLRQSEASADKSFPEERFHGQNLPPPPPFLPMSFVPQSVGANRRDEDSEKRSSNTRHLQRLSPRHDEKDRRHSEENLVASQDDIVKRRREDDFRERKHEERDGSSTKVDEREREKGVLVKDDMDAIAASKRRKIKRDIPSNEAGIESSIMSQPTHSSVQGISQPLDGRERDRKGGMVQHRSPYVDETGSRIHPKESSKLPRRENDQLYEREWEEEKRLRAEAKRKHRK